MNVREFLGGLATAAAVALGAVGLAACGRDPIQPPQPPCCTAPVPTTGIEVGTNPADQGWHQAWAGEGRHRRRGRAVRRPRDHRPVRERSGLIGGDVQRAGGGQRQRPELPHPGGAT